MCVDESLNATAPVEVNATSREQARRWWASALVGVDATSPLLSRCMRENARLGTEIDLSATNIM
eukprot:365709-Chlamydomonas_euryale.AAC.9